MRDEPTPEDLSALGAGHASEGLFYEVFAVFPGYERGFVRERLRIVEQKDPRRAALLRGLLGRERLEEVSTILKWECEVIR